MRETSEVMMTTERPNTVAGLVEKRGEIAGQLRLAETNVRSLSEDLAALDRCIRIFAPDIDGTTIRARPVPSAHRAFKGEMSRAVMQALRAATAPVTSLDIARAVIEARSLPTDDKTVSMIRKRSGAALWKLKAKGVAVEVPQEGEYKGWKLA